MKNLPVGIKLTAVLIITLVVVLGISFFIQNLLVSKNLEDLSNLGARAIFSSVVDSMGGSLEKGNMDLFYRDLEKASKAKNVDSITLFGGDGKQIRAAGSSAAVKTLSADLLKKLAASTDILLIQQTDAVDLYQVDTVDSDCIRCHPGWKIDAVGAILHMRYAKDDLVRAQTSNLWTNIIALTATVILLMVTMFVFIRILVSKPLEKMVVVAKKISSRDLAEFIQLDKMEHDHPAAAVAGPKIDPNNRDEIRLTEHAFSEVIAFISEITAATSRLAKGDLTVEVRPRSERDVFGIALEMMIEEFRSIISQLSESSTNLRQASTDLSKTAADTGESTDQINQGIQGIAKDSLQETQLLVKTNQMVTNISQFVDEIQAGAENQVGEVAKARQVSNQITQAIQQLATNAQKVSQGAAQATQAAKSGNTTVQGTIDEMQKIKVKTELTSQKIQEMGSRSDQIGAIVGTIENISSQTNLLALNAAIEAARAGEHGRGFAVVAEEVRKLADQASQATKEIKKLIDGIQDTVREATVAMDASIKQVEMGVRRAQQANQSLSEILGAAQGVTDEARLAFEATQRMTSYSNQLIKTIQTVSEVAEENTQSVGKMMQGYSEIYKAMDEISTVAEQDSATTEEVAASTEEMRQSISDMAESAKSLAGMAVDLEQIISAFSI